MSTTLWENEEDRGVLVTSSRHGLVSVSLWTQLAHHVSHHAGRSSCSRLCSCPLGLFLTVSRYRKSDRIQNRCEDKDDCAGRWRAGVLCRRAAAAQLRYCPIDFSETRRTSSFVIHLPSFVSTRSNNLARDFPERQSSVGGHPSKSQAPQESAHIYTAWRVKSVAQTIARSTKDYSCFK